MVLGCFMQELRQARDVHPWYSFVGVDQPTVDLRTNQGAK
jgi:hypothetical protein